MFLVVQVKITAYACSLSHGTGQETLLLLHTDFSLTLITEWIQDYSEEENEIKGEYILAHVNVENRPVRSPFIFLFSSLQMRDPSASLPYPSECLSLRSLDVLRQVSLSPILLCMKNFGGTSMWIYADLLNFRLCLAIMGLLRVSFSHLYVDK